jgi:ribonuclease J
MIALTFYGGVGEIGDNKILLEDDDKIFLDFGMSFKQRKRFYSDPYLSPRKDDMEGLTVTGLLPRIEGVYEFNPKVKQVDMVLISHAHADHARYISFLMRGSPIPGEFIEDFLREGTPLLSNEKFKRLIREDPSVGLLAELAISSGYSIPVLCSRKTARIIHALYDPQPNGCSRGDFETSIKGLDIHGVDYSERFKTSEYIQAFPVNHSIDGATAWVINTSGGTIVYTGDFRAGELTDKFTENAKNSEPTVMICEGTNIGRVYSGLKSENEVEEKIDEIITKHKNQMVFVDFAYKDMDRFKSLVRLAEEHDRSLVVPPKLAHLAMALRELDNSVPDIEKNSRIIVYI